jgi:copper oxidase (laccase) domain-containing protein
VVHGIFTRLGGHSRAPFDSLNVGGTVGDDPAAVQANLAAVASALGIAPGELASARQVHGARVGLVDRAKGGQVLPETDALVTATPRRFLLLRFADCVPILFWAPDRNAVALAHAGWRETVAGVAAATVRTMQEVLGCDPATW